MLYWIMRAAVSLASLILIVILSIYLRKIKIFAVLAVVLSITFFFWIWSYPVENHLLRFPSPDDIVIDGIDEPYVNSISDTNGSTFEKFKMDIKYGRIIMYATITEINSPAYRLYINGEQVGFELGREQGIKH